MSTNDKSDNITYPSIVFKIKSSYFAINCKNVASIMQMPSIEPLPDAPTCISGIFRFRDKVISMINIRSLFGMPTLEKEFEEFTSMLEHRKQDHINWVKELNRCIKTDEKFTLATDPHKCAFGRWYDSYETDNNSIRFLLNKIDEPHRLLHETAHEVNACKRDCDHCRNEECLRKKMERLEGELMPKILSLLDDAKDLFTSFHRNMLIVIELEDYTFSIIVDDVLAVEELIDASDEDSVDKLQGSPYISGIKKSTKIPRLILAMDDRKLGEIAKEYKHHNS